MLLDCMITDTTYNHDKIFMLLRYVVLMQDIYIIKIIYY